MQITPRFLILLLITALPLAATSLSPLFVSLTVAWVMLLLAFLLIDLRLTPRAGDWELARSHDQRLSLAIWNKVVVEVRLRRGLRNLRVWLRDEPPLSFRVGIGDGQGAAGVKPISHSLLPLEETHEKVYAAPGSPRHFTYYVYPPRRGDYRFGDLHLRWESVLGLVRRQARFPAAEAVKVYPNLVDIKKYDLLLRRNRLWELGLRTTRIFGSGTEFERLRDYLPDDEYRRIDWKATARRGKPVSVEYETERSQNLMVLLDIGRMMRSPVGDVSKLDYAINAVLLLAYVTTQKGDKLGLLAFADQVRRWLAPRGGKGQFQRMLELLYGVESEPVEPDYNTAFAYFAARQFRRSLVLVFTDLTGSVSTEALIAQMGRLSRSHLGLLVTISDPTVQRLARQNVVDSPTLYQRTVAEQLLEERKLTLERLRQGGIQTLDVPADELSVAVINKYLELKARAQI
ncbi:MAG: DUF58 domain-containing protein [Chloroflexi bacterium]|nr:DUF58 domain-containing protein [Chloroflexota bacterium]